MPSDENEHVLELACEGGKTASALLKRVFLEDKKRKTKTGKPVMFPVWVRNVQVFWPCGAVAKFPITSRKGTFGVSDSRHKEASCGLDATERGYTLGTFERELGRLVGEGAARALIGHCMG